ncbi:c-type cytochrome [Paraburkholderia acidisoli]|uniref:C-type cytochrome n=1 Tax=Paraburkholderia acidisoli TaxID=2571748 RepID=A0A7Z2GK45_9BURK|nr:c-type cytochrome [Paraburkholderia acidisoli]QGZ63191.1 c-type cytochrome [Paraburkholderia acidisoli]
MPFLRSLALRFVLTLTCALPAVSFADSPADSGADVQAGRALFMRNGCYECHGIFGQGSISTGPALAPHPLPLAAMQAYVHAPKGQMPPFSEKILSNADIARIHQYLESISPGPAAASIALLNDGVATQRAEASPVVATLEHGASIYTANCAACHGQGGQGGVGPALAGIAAKLSLDGVEARIREPSGIMPKLYPNPLDAADVQDVARYVMSLK